MRYYLTLFICGLLFITSSHPGAAEESEKSDIPSQEKAHAFFSYLIERQVIAVSLDTKCRTSSNPHRVTEYIQQPCKSVFRSAYECSDGQKRTMDTEIDWSYISEMKQSGYDQEGDEITLLGNINTFDAQKKVEEKKAKDDISTRSARITFDSSATAKRALKAFELFKNKCDTSAAYPF